MAKPTKKRYVFYPIGTTLYLVYKTYVDDKLPGGQIVACRVKSYQNVQGKILPVLTEVGNARRKVSPTTHYIYKNIRKAINAIDHAEKD